MAKPADSQASQRELACAKFPWESALGLVQPHLPDALAPSHHLKRLWSFARSIPGSWHWGMFETRLQKDAAPIDLLGLLVQTEETRFRLNKALEHALPESISPARQILRGWADDSGSEYSRSPNLWFEWDQDTEAAPPLPWLCIAPDFFDPGRAPLGPSEIGALAEEFMACDETLLIPGASKRLEKIASALPTDGKLMGFASLRPRGRDICRVFCRLPRGSMRKWLVEIGWPGDFDRLDDVLPLFDVEGEDNWCQLEFAEDVGPYLALELAQTERGFPHREARERWLGEMVQRGWATSEKAASVMNWHGQSDCSLPGAPPVRLVRSFHLKLALVEGAEPLAKAYLGFYFRKKRRALAA